MKAPRENHCCLPPIRSATYHNSSGVKHKLAPGPFYSAVPWYAYRPAPTNYLNDAPPAPNKKKREEKEKKRKENKETQQILEG